ncbi:hypothetical protein BH18ACT9_BH18ACT9_04790 [soil metagenome]
MNPSAAVALCAALLTLAGCGTGDNDAASQAISDSIMESQDDDPTSGVFAMERKEADCIGDGFVDEIGVEQLQEYGLLTEDLKRAEGMTDAEMSTQDAESASIALFDCTNVSKMMSEAFSSAGTLDAQTRACMEDALSEDVLRDMFTLMFSGKQEEAGQLATEPLTECAGAR